MSYNLEICVDSTQSALAAYRGGANRIELCSNLIIGGTSPCPELFKQIRKQCDLPIRVLIRPRFGDFCYEKEEIELIKEEVKMYRNLGADAAVVGILTPDGNLDVSALKVLRDAASNMELAFHRAFDMCVDPMNTLEELVHLGFTTILTSGQKSTALEGKDLLKQLVIKADDRIEILAGAGVSPNNITELIEATGVSAYHMSGKRIKDSRMLYRNENVCMGVPGFSEYEIWETDEEKVRAARKILDNV